MAKATTRKGKARTTTTGPELKLADERRRLQRILKQERHIRKLVGQLRRSESATLNALRELGIELSERYPNERPEAAAGTGTHGAGPHSMDARGV